MLFRIGPEDVLTVSEFVRRVASAIQRDFPLVRLKGEIASLKSASSQHVYFILKDSEAQVNAVLFRGTAVSLRFQLENGLEVVVSGRPGLYDKRGDFRLVVDEVEPAGMGAQQLAFEQLKRKLEAEGLFAAAAKQPLPPVPAVIGLVTSGSGAAVRDVLHVLRRRMPSVRVVLAPVPVQGEAAAPAIVAAIGDMNRLDRIDLMIVGRGGGCSEDLQAFNDESVARAIFASRVPVISAVGHETDFTIADFVADLRAPTPSAAAELAVPEREDLRLALSSLARRIFLAAETALELRRRNLRHVMEGYVMRRFPAGLEETVRRTEMSLDTLRRAWEAGFVRREADIATLAARLQALDPLATLSRGYSITRLLPGGRAVSASEEVAAGDLLETILSRGVLLSKVTEVRE